MLKCISMRAILGLQGVVQEGTWRVSGAMSQLANTGTNQPQPGERILLYQAGWLQQVVDGEKTMEVQSVSCQPSGAWLGSEGVIRAWAHVGKAFQVEDIEELRDYGPEHRYECTQLPYRRTFLWPLEGVRVLQEPVPYQRESGPTTWLPFQASTVAAGLSGLVNRGNSCFINAALQALFNTAAWRRAICASENAVAQQLSQVLTDMMNAARGGRCVEPKCILRQWYRGVHEDSSEFLNQILSEAGLDTATAGTEQFQVQCREGGTEVASGLATPMSQALMPIPGKSERVQLQEVVDEYLANQQAPEGLRVSGEAWQCPGCASRVAPWRRLRILRSPEILVVTLKRWDTELVEGCYVEKKNEVSGPVFLQGEEYHVSSLVHHVGESTTSGHYYALLCCGHPCWVLYDDTGVRDSDVNSRSQNLYVAVLERVHGGTASPCENVPATQVDGGTSAEAGTISVENEVAGAEQAENRSGAGKAAQAAIAGNGDNKIEAAAAFGSSVNASKPSDSLQLENSEKTVSRTLETETAAAGVGGAACVDGVLPSAAKPLECLCEGTEWLEQDPQRQFEEDVVRFLRAACEGPVSEALAGVPPRSDHVDQLSLQQCLSRLAAGLRGVREGALTAAGRDRCWCWIVIVRLCNVAKLRGVVK